MMLTYHQAAELGEALLDAAKMAENNNEPIGVIQFRAYMLATRRFDEGEALIVVLPATHGEDSKIVPIRGTF